MVDAAWGPGVGGLSGVLFSMLLAAAGCGAEESGIPEGDFPAAVAHASCDELGPCCAQAGLPYDAGACRALIQGTSGFQPDNTRYDSDAAERCVKALQRAVSQCASDGPSLAACHKVYVGTVPPGQPCASSEECAPSGGIPLCESGACRVYLHGAVGDSCGSGGDTLCLQEDGVYCDVDVCVALPEAGEACAPALECAEGARCVGTTCEAQLPLGSACTSAGQCETRHCDGTCVWGNIASKEACTGSFTYN
ncbi:MAG: hypothetical protein KC776_10390 [Myxococcales bacterium]|nr:hypothetical protein [Myxococcales bacterium]MCB9577686.1 hypothetical protein [Polyangiaceae bacterium]